MSAVCLTKLSLWTYWAVQYALVFAFVHNPELGTIEVDPDLKHHALFLIVSGIVVDLIFFISLQPWTALLTAIPIYFLWGTLHVVSTGFGRLIWLR